MSQKEDLVTLPRYASSVIELIRKGERTHPVDCKSFEGHLMIWMPFPMFKVDTLGETIE